MKNHLETLIGPIERFLDENIESGNIWYYIIGLIAIFIYLIFF